MIAVAVSVDSKDLDCCGVEPCSKRIPGVKLWTLADGSEYDTCPALLVTRESVEMLRWYQRYKSNLLPISGGLLDQSAWYLDAMDHIEQQVGHGRKNRR